jgi:hypothetical protein
VVSAATYRSSVSAELDLPLVGGNHLPMLTNTYVTASLRGIRQRAEQRLVVVAIVVGDDARILRACPPSTGLSRETERLRLVSLRPSQKRNGARAMPARGHGASGVVPTPTARRSVWKARSGW